MRALSKSRKDSKPKIRREYLKILRQIYGITAPQMAEKVGLSCRQHYLRYENGEREFGDAVRKGYFMIFCRVFSMPMAFFEEAEADYLSAKGEFVRAFGHSRKAECRKSDCKRIESDS
ncbi:MAG: helix-turn-helix transcriptional regulator [Eubacterium sp.]|nr:helix-turn-helix transcriptional regulator [Eubacterium sp.]